MFFYKGHLIRKVDTKQTIQEILQQAIEYFGSQGASLDELVELFQTNVPLKFNIEDALPYDSTLKELVESGGIGSKQYFPNGINVERHIISGVTTHYRSLVLVQADMLN